MLQDKTIVSCVAAYLFSISHTTEVNREAYKLQPFNWPELIQS
jgi:hypothetical protein